MKELLKNIILDQQQLTWNEKFIRRDFPDYYLTTKDIVVISGVRRCGKSTLLHQIRQIMQSGISILTSMMNGL